MWLEYSKARGGPGFCGFTGLLAAIPKHCHKFPVLQHHWRDHSHESSSTPHLREFLWGQSGSMKWSRYHLKSPASCPSPAAFLFQKQLETLHHCLWAAWETIDDMISVRQLLGPVFVSSLWKLGSPGDISFLKKRRATRRAILYKQRWDLNDEARQWWPTPDPIPRSKATNPRFIAISTING